MYESKNVVKLIADGEYEAVIENMEVFELPNSGKEILKVKFRIRDDIEQNEKGRIIVEDIWKDKEHPECFNCERMSKLIYCAGVPEGKTLENLEEVIKTLVGSFLRIVINTKYDSYRNTDVNRVYYYKPTENKAKVVGEKKEEVKNDELPF